MMHLKKIKICIFLFLNTLSVYGAEIDKTSVTINLDFGLCNQNCYTVQVFTDNTLKHSFQINAQTSPQYTCYTDFYDKIFLGIICIAPDCLNSSDVVLKPAFSEYTAEDIIKNNYKIHCFVPSLIHEEQSTLFIRDTCGMQ